MALAEVGEVILVDATEHVAERPSWDCLCCRKPWPCDPAREYLAGRMDRVRLATYMWDQLDQACGDLPAGPPLEQVLRHALAVELFHRFIKWTH